MIKIASLIIALTFIVAAKSSLGGENYQYKLCNNHNFTFFLLDVYDISLCVDDEKYLYPHKIFQTNFTIIINYNMNFNKKELSESSIKEINRYYNISKKDQNEYYKQLISIFPNVKKGDIIKAQYNKAKFIDFYHNDLPIGKISDQKFSKIFLDIWLHKDNKYQKMTKDLFKKS